MARLEGLYDAIAAGLRSDGLLGRIKGMEAEKDRLAAALDRPAPSPVRLHPNLAEIHRAKVAELHRALEDPSIRDETLHIPRGLVERIVITPRTMVCRSSWSGAASRIKLPRSTVRSSCSRRSMETGAGMAISR
jgi:hypothetical protein